MTDWVHACPVRVVLEPVRNVVLSQGGRAVVLERVAVVLGREVVALERVAVALGRVVDPGRVVVLGSDPVDGVA